MLTIRPEDLPLLRSVAHQFPTIDAAAAQIAHLRGVLSLPKGTVHVVSDVHGEHKKLQHIINNASGALRPLIEQVFGARLAAEHKQELLNTVYYPKQMFDYLTLRQADPASRAAWAERMLGWQFELIDALRSRYSFKHVESLFPAAYELLFHELLWESRAGGRSSYVRALLDALAEQRKELTAVRWASRVIRNLCVYELVCAGDLGDRGPRLDKVCEVLMRQPRVTVTWGNHDVSWMGACLGHRALIATVVRISLRYHRIEQLEEGYGISLEPLEALARAAYGADPATRFRPKVQGSHDADGLSRMHKAIAIIQFKLESQIIARHPEYEMERADLIRHIDLARGTVRIDEREHPLLDSSLPTVDPRDASALSPAENECIDRLREAFLDSALLWEHMSFLARAGRMVVVRDKHLIFHGCVPVDERGELLTVPVDGVPRKGRDLFDALNLVVHRALRESRDDDLDMLWYLWTGPRSPLFGKDRMTTFERHFVADDKTHKETKNPYFKLLHDPAFSRKVLAEMGVDLESGMIVNGHVPVKPDQGEDPLKQSGNAITIDGAFSEAYGDRGYTLILDPDGTRLAEHHHFESVAEALEHGADILPVVREVRRFDPPRRVGDTEAGDDIRAEIAALENLIAAYQANLLAEGRAS
jgi:fructose-1,6-bisphosphatase-3